MPLGNAKGNASVIKNQHHAALQKDLI